MDGKFKFFLAFGAGAGRPGCKLGRIFPFFNQYVLGMSPSVP